MNPHWVIFGRMGLEDQFEHVRRFQLINLVSIPNSGGLGGGGGKGGSSGIPKYFSPVACLVREKKLTINDVI